MGAWGHAGRGMTWGHGRADHEAVGGVDLGGERLQRHQREHRLLLGLIGGQPAPTHVGAIVPPDVVLAPDPRDNDGRGHRMAPLLAHRH